MRQLGDQRVQNEFSQVMVEIICFELVLFRIEPNVSARFVSPGRKFLLLIAFWDGLARFLVVDDRANAFRACVNFQTLEQTTHGFFVRIGRVRLTLVQ